MTLSLRLPGPFGNIGPFLGATESSLSPTPEATLVSSFEHAQIVWNNYPGFQGGTMAVLCPHCQCVPFIS